MIIHRRVRWAVVSVLALATACSAPKPSGDAATDGSVDRVAIDSTSDVPQDATTRCSAASDCDDHLFCTGVEQCMPAAANADARGCVAGTNPCASGGMCDEAMDRCSTSCVDADGDMHSSSACGGDDCDDTNASIHPGATEICDAMNHDEDCDPRTFGFRDSDGDSYADSQCCNATATGMMNCGDDCNDSRPNVHPALVEACDGLDNNCDGMIDEGVQRTFFPDRDGDGFGDSSGASMMGCSPPAGYAEMGTDCDDTVASVHPGAVEQCDVAMVDEDCDGVANPSSLCTCTGTSSRPCALPGACAAGTERCVSGSWGTCSIAPIAETCNGVDDDCDGTTDESLTVNCYADGDNDGYPASGATLSVACPVAGREPVGGCPANLTNRAPMGSAIDCNDTDASVSPAQVETCDGRDNDCDAMIDEGVATTYYRDGDGDGFGDATMSMSACAAATGYVSVQGDCDDSRASVHPGATELCDAAMVDENCDGTANEGCACTVGMSRSCAGALGVCAAGTQTCVSGSWGACSISPTAEACNGVDDNCNGMTDEGTTVACYDDADNDTYTSPGTPSSARCPVSGRPSVGGCPTGSTNRAPASGGSDCDDTNPARNPAALEVCNGIDDDCDGLVDESLRVVCYVDSDNDGYAASSATAMMLCSDPTRGAFGGCPVGTTNRVPTTGAADCNDTNASVNPGAAELCDAPMVDENCSGVANEGCSCSGSSTRACPLPGACAAGTQTCSSGSWGMCSIAPTAETCNMVDDNCNGSVDEGLTVTCYPDADNDTYAASGATASQRCPDSTRGAVGNCPTGTTNRVPTGSAIDCADTNSAVNPGATETCNGSDDNCNGAIDEGVTTTWYRDADADGYGVSSTTMVACMRPTGYASSTNDCNDTNASIHPGAAEACNGIDDNCNGTVDEGVRSTFYRDADGDGYGNPSMSLSACSPPVGYVLSGTDCDDTRSTIHPGATEICGNGFDDNCDGTIC